jgi:acetate kinase
MRATRLLAEAGDVHAQLAIKMYCYRIRKYIGAYLAVLGHLDALVFTAGIGENAPAIREEVCSGLDALGIVLDPGRNRETGGQILEIQQAGAPVHVLVIPTNEEIEIAREAAACVAAAGSDGVVDEDSN